MPRKPGTFLEVAEVTLRAAKTPLTATEIIERGGVPEGCKGRTPVKTLYAALLREVRLKGEQSRFGRSPGGKFVYRS